MTSTPRARAESPPSTTQEFADAEARIGALCEAAAPGEGLPAAAARIVTVLAGLTGSPRASLMVVNPATGLLSIAAAEGLAADLVGRDVSPRPRGIAEWVYRNRRGLILNGEVSDQRYEGCARGSPIESALSLPILGPGGIAGVINLARRPPAPVFSEDDLGRIEGLIGPVADMIATLQRAALAARALRQLEASEGAARRTLLAPGVTPVRGYDLGLTHVPGMRRGGDLCERLPHGTAGNGVLALDVPGDGAAAALASAFAHGLFVATAAHERSTAALVARIGCELHARFGGLQFAALWTALLGRGGEVSSCTAGYPAPFWVPADGSELQRLASGGPPAGALPQAAYDEEQVRLLPGDLIVAVSDGVLAARDAGGLAFGEERVAELLDGLRHDAPDRLGAALCEAALAFGGRPAPVDDLVVLAIRYAPES